MVNRKKRLQKGVESLNERIEEHEEKLETAEKEGNLELADYYKKEISTFEKDKEKKKRILEK